MPGQNDRAEPSGVIAELIKSGAIPVKPVDEYEKFREEKERGAKAWEEANPAKPLTAEFVQAANLEADNTLTTVKAVMNVGSDGRITSIAHAPTDGPAVAGERITPLEDRVVILPDEAVKRTPGGIIIPDVAQEKPMRGQVIAVGPGRRTDATGVLIPMTLTVGMRVLFARYQGEFIKSGDTDYRILREKDVSAVLG